MTWQSHIVNDNDVTNGNNQQDANNRPPDQTTINLGIIRDDAKTKSECNNQIPHKGKKEANMINLGATCIIGKQESEKLQNKNSQKNCENKNKKQSTFGRQQATSSQHPDTLQNKMKKTTFRVLAGLQQANQKENKATIVAMSNSSCKYAREL